MQATLCPFCMNPAESEICPYCGKNINHPGKIGHLPVGSTLQWIDTYILGAAIGQGGFGITYIALNATTMEKVAIKEYFPTHCCTRADMTTVYPYSDQEDAFTKGKLRFLEEARMLKSLSDLDSVVNVRDLFEANNTAYLVMEYLDGGSLKDHVEQNGKLPAQEFFVRMKPLMTDMEKMHQRGVVHRDIAPDNIIMLSNGRLKLIDFGAARSYIGDKSMTVVVKKGFAPVEQYMRKGSNASTDVYALAATIYYCVTGIVPPDSAERQYGEASLQAPTSLGVELSWKQEHGLEKALEIQPKDRTSSIAALMKDLYVPQNPTEAPRKAAKPLQDTPNAENRQLPDLSALLAKIPPLSSLKDKLQPKWIIATAAAVAVLVGGIALLSGPDEKVESVSATVPSIAAPVVQTPPETTIPTPPETQPSVPSYVMTPEYWGLTEEYFWGQKYYRRDDVRTVRFIDSLEGAPSDAQDVSEAQDGTILVWMIDGNLTVAANGRIAPHPEKASLFEGMTYLESIDFGTAFDTSNVTNMTRMFYYNHKLAELDLSCFDTSNVTTMEEMFTGCSNLRKIDVTSFDTSNVTDMYRMFDNCNNLIELDVSGFDTSNVADFRAMFSFCESLTELDVSNFDTSSATGLTQMFMCCSALTALDVSSFDTSNVTDMASMFSSCKALTALDVSSFNTSNVTDMDSMFSSCSSLTALDVSSFDTSNVTDMGSMFSWCESLTALDVSSFDTSKVRDMFHMFWACESLTALDVSSFDTSNVTDMRSMFNSCSSLTALDVSNFDISNVTNTQGMFSGCKFPTPSWYNS